MDQLEIFDQIASQLHTAVISDVLDALGVRNHSADPVLRPLAPGVRLVGTAMTVAVAELDSDSSAPYRGEIAALDDLRPGEVCVVAGGGTTRAGLWGELFSAAAAARGCRGAIIDGYVRDQERILAAGFSVFSRGGLPVDCRGRTSMTERRVPVTLAGLEVQPGDVVVADIDGIVVIPDGLLRETHRHAIEKASKENLALRELARGSLLGTTFNRHGVL